MPESFTKTYNKYKKETLNVKSDANPGTLLFDLHTFLGYQCNMSSTSICLQTFQY